MYASGKNLPAPTIRMSPRPGEPNSCFEPRPEVENTELYERCGPYHGTAAGSNADRGLTEADIQDEIKNIPIARARELLLKLLQEDPHAKRIMETQFLSTGIRQPQMLTEWEGKYTLKCPAITQGWGYDDRNFNFTVYSSSSHLWISFNLGLVSGIMRSDLPEVGKMVWAQWRGREEGGLMIFEYGNTAHLTFFGDGNVECELGGDFMLGMAHFTGSRDNSTKPPENKKAEIKKLKTEFRNYNFHNYEVERNRRLGQLGGEEKTDSPYQSNTSVSGVADTAMWDDGHKRKADARGELDDDESIRLMKRQRLKMDMI